MHRVVSGKDRSGGRIASFEERHLEKVFGIFPLPDELRRREDLAGVTIVTDSQSGPDLRLRSVSLSHDPKIP